MLLRSLEQEKYRCEPIALQHVVPVGCREVLQQAFRRVQQNPTSDLLNLLLVDLQASAYPPILQFTILNLTFSIPHSGQMPASL